MNLARIPPYTSRAGTEGKARERAAAAPGSDSTRLAGHHPDRRPRLQPRGAHDLGRLVICHLAALQPSRVGRVDRGVGGGRGQAMVGAGTSCASYSAP
jgi:hypothetical protein